MGQTIEILDDQQNPNRFMIVHEVVYVFKNKKADKIVLEGSIYNINYEYMWYHHITIGNEKNGKLIKINNTYNTLIKLRNEERFNLG